MRIVAASKRLPAIEHLIVRTKRPCRSNNEESKSRARPDGCDKMRWRRARVEGELPGKGRLGDGLGGSRLPTNPTPDQSRIGRQAAGNRI